MSKYLKQTTTFLTEVKTEIKKVSWPSRKETTGGTVVVLIAVLIIASFLGIVDISLSKIVKILIQY
jgi:preprotein translocase subunit SecE|tara:strand:- start:351 stop:548 length:198 start_codon:yes stop_codon:yes gene_type:complete